MSPEDRDPDEELDRLLEELRTRLGDRWGNDARLDPLDTEHTLQIGVVDPSPSDIVFAGERGQAHGWMVTVVGVRYSKPELLRFQSAITTIMMEADDIVGCGFGLAQNKVMVMLSRLDAGVIARVLEVAPADALAFEIRPGVRYMAL